MIKNIISVGNQAEIEILRVASESGVTTGGWSYKIRNDRLGLFDRGYNGYQKAYLDNLRASDITVILTLPDRLPTQQQNLKDLILQYRFSKSIADAYLSSSDIPGILEKCKSCSAEVINFVFLKGKIDKEEASRRIGYFAADFIDAAGDLLVKGAEPIWRNLNRLHALRSKSNKKSTSKEVYDLTDARHAPEIKQIAQRELTRFFIDLPLDTAVKSLLLNNALASLETELQRQIELSTSLDRKMLERIWQHEARKSLSSHDRRAPKRKSRFTDHVASFLIRNLNLPDVCQEPHPLDPDHIVLASDIASRTEKREERYLRTFMLLHLGGLARSKHAKKAVKDMLPRLIRANHEFSPESLNRRFKGFQIEGATGWDAILNLGSRMKYDRNSDPFFKHRLPKDRETLEAELFYFTDDFCNNCELWTAESLSSFTESLCFLCGTDTSKWEEWIGPATLN